MFRALRAFFGTADPVRLGAKLRPKRAMRLFVFEFSVVVLGVLAAQLLQQWVVGLTQRREAEQAVAQARADVATMRANANYWLGVAPCLARHVDVIARAAGQGRTMARAEVGRPALPGLDQIRWSEAISAAVRKRFGASAAADYVDLASTAQTIDDSQIRLGERWAAFPLLDPTLGQPSAADRANVRLAAAQIATDLNFIVFQSRYVIERAGILAIQPSASRSEELRPLVNGCGLLREWNAVIEGSE